MAIRSINKSSLLRLTSYAKATARGVSTSILIIFSILLLILGKIDEGFLIKFKSRIFDLSAYILEVVGKPVNSISESITDVNNFLFLYSQNKNLKDENRDLYKWKDLGQKLLEENRELRKLLKAANKIPEKYITANIIANSAGSYIKTITINVGKKDGVKLGNAVVNNWGMIGRIVQLGNNVARVLLITDINSQIPVYFERSKHRAILIGKNSNLLEIKFLKNRVNILDQDRLITSGEGGLLPRGLVVGKYIKEINKNLEIIRILPTKNWDNFNNLNVILYEPMKELF
tara:strand:+ start:40 stop:903 length:864 start_codon:yes stop_codon:yes gene_type:complete